MNINIHGKNNSKATNYIHNSICIKKTKPNTLIEPNMLENI